MKVNILSNTIGLSRVWFIGFPIFLVAFVLFTVFVGGDALSGKIENQRYYVASGTNHTEVSRAAFVTSAALCILVSSSFLGFTWQVINVLHRRQVFEERPGLKLCLLIFFGVACITISLYGFVVMITGLAT